jgi:hypothetical protein
MNVYPFDEWLPDPTPARCDVCNGESGGTYVGVACSALGAVSFAHCDRCATADAESVGMLRGVVEDAGGLHNLMHWVGSLTTWYNGTYVRLEDLPSLTLAETDP